MPGLLQDLRADAERAVGAPSLIRYLAAAARSPEHVAAIDYRFGRALRRTAPGRVAASALHTLVRVWSGVDINPHATIEGGLLLVHGSGTVVGPGVVIGQNCTIYQGVTLGQHHSGEPTIGDGVTVHPGARVMGAITVGDRAHVGANAVLMRSVPADHTATGVPVKPESIRPTTWQ
jgi:serine O-acetyltransferase